MYSVFLYVHVWPVVSFCELLLCCYFVNAFGDFFEKLQNLNSLWPLKLYIIMAPGNYLVVLVDYPLAHGRATLISLEYSSVTEPSLGNLSSTRTRSLHFCQKLLVTSVHAKAFVQCNNCRKNFMISRNESDLHHPSIKPRSLNSHSNILPIELTWQCNMYTSISCTHFYWVK